MRFFLRQLFGLVFPTRATSLEQFIELLQQKSVTNCRIFKGMNEKYSAWPSDGSNIAYYPKWNEGNLFLHIWEDMQRIKAAIPDITFDLQTGARLVEVEVERYRRDERREHAIQKLKQLNPQLYTDIFA